MALLDDKGLKHLVGKLKDMFAPKSHTHDDRYYTESEIDSKLAGKANSSHTHSYLPLSGGTTTGRITAPEVAATSYFVTPTMVGEGDTNTYYHRVDWGKAGNDKVDFYEYGGVWNFYKNTAAGKDSAALVASIQSDGVHANLKGKADTAGTADFAKTFYYNVRKSVDLTKLDINTWYPVIGDWIPYDGFHRLKCAVQLNSGTKPSWSSHSNGGFTAIVEVLQTAYGYGTTRNYGIVLQNDWLWVSADNSPVGYGQQLKNASTPVFWLRGGGVYFLYADYDCSWSIKTESYTASSQTVAPTKTYPGVSVDRSTIMANVNGNAKTATTATNANNAAQAAKLTTNAGSATQPVYFSNGVPVATTYTLGKSVPSNAVFTDTNTWRGVQNNLTSDSTDQSLSAAQGKVLKGLVDGKAAANHTHSQYLTSHQDISGKVDKSEAGANSLLATLNTTWTATPTDDTYFVRQDTGGGSTFGRVKFSTLWSYIKGKGDSAYQAKGSYAAASHTHKYAGSSSAGGSANSAVKLDTATAGSATQPVYFTGGKPVATSYTLAKSVPADAKFTDTNTWRGIQNNLTSDSTTDSLSAAQGKVLKSLVDGKAASSHTHTKSQITDFPSSLPASDVYAWAKAGTKPSYTKSEVGLGNVDNTADSAKSVKYATSAGSAGSATKATGVVDYGATGKTIEIGYGGSGISGDNIKYIAGYTTGDGSTVTAKIKDVSKDDLKSWIGLGSAAYSATSAFAPSSHTHPYAGAASSGGSATSAVKLDTSTAGSATQPVYFTGGKPAACAYTLGKSVPSNAVFTDTTYGDATTSAHGLMTAADKSKLNGIATGANKTVVDSTISQSSTNPVQNKVITKRLQYLYSFKISRDKWNEASDKSNWNVIVSWTNSSGTALTGSTTGTPNLTTDMSLGPAMMERTSSLSDNIILSGELSMINQGQIFVCETNKLSFTVKRRPVCDLMLYFYARQWTT